MLRQSQTVLRNLWGVSTLWLLALALCLLGWSLLDGSGDTRQNERVARAGEVASVELAPMLLRSDTPVLGPQVRALLVRQDIGFAWLRVRDAQGRVVAAAGRLESGRVAGLPSGLRRQLYTLISHDRSTPLVHQGLEAGVLEFGLLIGGGGLGGTGGKLLLALLLLGLGLPALCLLSLRLKTAFLRDWGSGGTMAARNAATSVLDSSTALRTMPSRQGASLPAVTGDLFKVFDLGAIVIDRNQAVLDLNAQAAALTGWSPSQAQGRPLSEVLQLFHADLKQTVQLSLENCFSGGRERLQARYFLRARDHALYEVDIDAAPLREPSGEVGGVLLSLRQVEKVSQALQRIVPESALAPTQDPRQLSQMLLDQVLECVITTDSQDRIQFANGRALENFGYSLTELRGEHISRLLPVPFLRQVRMRVADLALTLPDMPTEEVVGRRRDGSQFAATLVVHAVSFRGQQGHVVTVRPRIPKSGKSSLSSRLSLLLESSPGEVYVADPDSLQLIAGNEYARKQLGFSVDQLNQITLLRLYPRLVPETLRDHITRLREGATDLVEFREWHQRANGSSYEVQSRLSLWTGEGTPVLLLVAQAVANIAVQPDAALREDKVGFLAYHDALTGLPSRPLFMQRLQQAIDANSRKPQPFAMVHLALSGFSEVNHEYGYETGDLLLKLVANRLSTSVGAADTVARLGGDEFILLIGLPRSQDATPLLRRLKQALSQPLRVGTHDIKVKACLGATVYPDDAVTPDLLLRHAGLALRAARAEGPGESRLYHASSTAAAGPSSPAEQLREAQARGELGIELQPLNDVRARLVIGAEVLLAWRYPGHGLLRTADQLRQASHNSEMADALGLWVLEQACEQQANWRNLELHTLPLLVNLSTLPLAGRSDAQALRGLLARYRVPPQHLIFMVNASELESLLLDHDSVLPVLRDLGLRIGMNDIDTGRMDLLRRADVDVVRLTPRTIAGLPSSRDAADQTAAIIQAGQRIGARIFASGVERAEQREALLALGCHYQQGRLLGEPVKAHEFALKLIHAEAGAF